MKRIWNEDKGMHEFERLALGMVELVDGTDNHKQTKLLEVMHGIVRWKWKTV
eukprot:SAG11_NODE_237_length_11835_cov_11.023347_2_plen_52_part_00